MFDSVILLYNIFMLLNIYSSGGFIEIQIDAILGILILVFFVFFMLSSWLIYFYFMKWSFKRIDNRSITDYLVENYVDISDSTFSLEIWDSLWLKFIHALMCIWSFYPKFNSELLHPHPNIYCYLKTLTIHVV